MHFGVPWLPCFAFRRLFYLLSTGALCSITHCTRYRRAGVCGRNSARHDQPRFSSPWVSYLPASASVPSPRAFFRRIPRCAGRACRFSQSLRVLSCARPPRRRAFGYLPSGVPKRAATRLLAIADEEGIAHLESLKAATAALARSSQDGLRLRRYLIASSRVIYYFNAAIHSDETGSTESVLELAYRLAASEQPMIRRIRQNLGSSSIPCPTPTVATSRSSGSTAFSRARRTSRPCRASRRYWSKYAFVDTQSRIPHQQTHETTKAATACFTSGIRRSCTT